MIGRRPAIALAMLLGLAVGLAVIAAAGGKDSSSVLSQSRERDARLVVNAIAAEFGVGETGACFWRIAWRESKLDPRAANWGDRHADGSRGSFGALQLGALHRRHGETVAAFARRMFIPRENARLAHALYRRDGLRPWGGFC